MCGVRGRRDPSCGGRLVLPGLATGCPPVIRMSSTMLSTNCAHSDAQVGSARSGLLLDAVGQLGDLRVYGPAFGHQGADFPVGIDDRGVVAAAELLADLGQRQVGELAA